MFEDAELGHAVDEETYARDEPPLRMALLEAQYDLLASKGFAALLVIGGVDGAGKGETVNTLNAWMDPRHIVTVGFGDPTDEERMRPPMWRYWRALPPKGKLGVFFGSWYSDPIAETAEARKPSWARLDASLVGIRRFERMLADEGVLLLKVWMHLSKQAQRRRLKALERDPDTAWRVTDADWGRYRRHERHKAVAERALRLTSQGHAPWLVVEGADERYRNLAVGRALLAALRGRLDAATNAPPAAPFPPSTPLVDARTVLSAVDQSRTLSEKQYDRERERWQERLARLVRDPRFAERSLVAVFEGMDAAGKGGAIRRVTGALDARVVRVVPVSAPTDEERAQPYLWRFWRQLPRHGQVLCFDRSWYGRVLVERVEPLCAPWDWQRAYGEINDFEDELVRHGVVVVKFWLTVSRAEQLRRFRAREATGFKAFKISPDDWRNRRKWGAYEEAVCDMVERTSTSVAPWHLVAADDKRWARVQVLKTLATAVARAIGRD